MRAAYSLRRQLSNSPSALSLYADISDQGRKPGTLLLETTDGLNARSGQSLVYLSSCLRIEGRGPRVVLTALNFNGQQLLQRLLAFAALPVQTQNEHTLVLNYSRHSDSEKASFSEMERLRSLSVFDSLRSLLASFKTASAEDQEYLQLVGHFAFESVELFEQFPAFPTGRSAPDFLLYVPELLAVLPRLGGAQLIALVFASETASKVENELSRQLQYCASLVEKNDKKPDTELIPVADLPQVSVTPDDEQFCQSVRKVQDHLHAGDAFQIVLSRKFSTECTEPLNAYRHLRAQNPSPYLFYFCTDDFVLLGASPESAVKVDGVSRQVTILPIAGTRVRGRNAQGDIDHDLDARLEVDLRLDEKEVAEHLMLVDLARNDIARIAKPGTRVVRELLQVARYARVMHLVSRVCGELRPELDALHAFAASMPMGTLSGAPKIRAIQILRDMEQQERACYGGAVGYLNAIGDMDTAIVIRAAVVRDGVAIVQAGAGVVLGSDPQAEADETRRKAEAVLRAIASAEQERQARLAAKKTINGAHHVA